MVMHMNNIEDLSNEIVEFFDRFSSWENSVIQSSDLTLSETHAIEVLGDHGEMSMRDLADRLGVTTGTTTVTVDRLEAGDYARRTRDGADRRKYIIRLTARGKEAFSDHHRHHLNVTEEIASLLEDDEAAELIKILHKINAGL